MSHQAIAWALKQPVKPTSAKHLLTVLAHYVSATRPGPWVAFPSISQLVLDTGQDRKTLMLNMKRLIEQGSIIDTGEREGGTKSVPVYMLIGPGSGTESGTPLASQSSTNTHTASTAEAVPEQVHLSSTNLGTAHQLGSSTNLPRKQYQSTPEAVPIYPTEQVEQVLKEERETTTPPPRAHAHPRTREAEPSSSSPTSDDARRRNVQVSVLLRRNGGCHGTHPQSRGVADLVTLGATDVEILTALETAKRQRQAAGSAQPVTAAYLVPIVREMRNKPADKPKGRFAEDIRQMRDLSRWADEQLRQHGPTEPITEIDMGAINATRND